MGTRVSGETKSGTPTSDNATASGKAHTEDSPRASMPLLEPFEALGELHVSDDLVDEYFGRIKLSDYDWRSNAKCPSQEMLSQIHSSHFTNIPFENFDCFFNPNGPEITLGSTRLQRKFLNASSKRGGYCYEHNKVLAAVLVRCGFNVVVKDARVWNDDGVTARKPYIPPTNHILLLVTIPGDSAGKTYLCDVGFGRLGFQYPLVFEEEAPQQSGHALCQLRMACYGKEQANLTGTVGKTLKELWMKDPGRGWKRGYSFDPDAEFNWVDCMGANMLTHSHPDSTFAKRLWCEQRDGQAPWTNRLLFGKSLRVTTHDVEADTSNTEVTEMTSVGHLRDTLVQHWGIELSESRLQFVFEFITQEWDRTENHRRVLQQRVDCMAEDSQR
eukprot:GFYU01002642.1.p1 GENE.GFYU01002642.1~~GFYU01002642.1.p1  ORF type:complete len:386 (-),score=83.59 GFYU01002642.1:159-1316(-)